MVFTNNKRTLVWAVPPSSGTRKFKLTASRRRDGWDHAESVNNMHKPNRDVGSMRELSPLVDQNNAMSLLLLPN